MGPFLLLWDFSTLLLLLGGIQLSVVTSQEIDRADLNPNKNLNDFHYPGEARHDKRILAVGQVARLGSLYDARTSTFTGMTIFRKPITGTDLIVITDTPSTRTEMKVVKNIKDKLDLLSVEASIHVQLMSGKIQIKGSAEYLSSEPDNYEHSTATLLHQVRTREENLEVNFDLMREYVSTAALQDRNATHVVTGISWGADVALNFEEIDSRKSFINNIGGSFYISLDFNTAFKVEAEGELHSDRVNTTSEDGYKFKIFADVDLGNSLPSNMEEIQQLLNSVPTLIKQSNKEKGKQMAFTLFPIDALRKLYSTDIMIGNLMADIENDILENVRDIYVEIKTTEDRLKNLALKCDQAKESLTNEQLKTVFNLREGFNGAAAKFKVELSQTLVQVKSLKLSVDHLVSLVQKFRISEFSTARTLYILDSDNEFQIIEEKIKLWRLFLQTGVEYVGRSKYFDNVITQYSHSHPITYILFYNQDWREKFSKTWGQNHGLFITTLNKPYNKLLVVDCAFQPCSTMNNTTIHQYRRGVCTSTNVYKDIKENLHGVKSFSQHAFGRAPSLGDLYDARTETFTSDSIFNTPLIRFDNLITGLTEFIYHNQTFLKSFDSFSMADKLAPFATNPNFELTLLTQLFQLQHSGRLFQDKVDDNDVFSKSIIYRHFVGTQSISLSNKNFDQVVDFEKLSASQPTHFVRSIEYGSASVLSLMGKDRVKVRNTIRKMSQLLQVIQTNFTTHEFPIDHLIKQLNEECQQKKEPAPLDSENENKFPEKQPESNVGVTPNHLCPLFDDQGLSIRVVSDLSLNMARYPRDMQDVLILFKELFMGLVRENGGKGKALRITFEPIESLREPLGILTAPHRERAVSNGYDTSSFVEAYDGLAAAERDIKKLKNSLNRLFMSDAAYQKLNIFVDKLLHFIVNMRENGKNLWRDFKSGILLNSKKLEASETELFGLFKNSRKWAENVETKRAFGNSLKLVNGWDNQFNIEKRKANFFEFIKSKEQQTEITYIGREGSLDSITNLNSASSDSSTFVLFLKDIPLDGTVHWENVKKTFFDQLKSPPEGTGEKGKKVTLLVVDCHFIKMTPCPDELESSKDIEPFIKRRVEGQWISVPVTSTDESVASVEDQKAELENLSAKIESDVSKMKEKLVAVVKKVDEKNTIQPEVYDKMATKIRNDALTFTIEHTRQVKNDLIKRDQVLDQRVTNEVEKLAEKLKTVKRNIRDFEHSGHIPYGFTFIQYPGQISPLTLWPYMTWLDISLEYAGLFFRVGGGKGAKDFLNGTTQCPSYLSTMVRSGYYSSHLFQGDTADHFGMPGTSTGIHFSGHVDYKNSKWSRGFQFTSGNEQVRPINKSIRMWRRINIPQHETISDQEEFILDPKSPSKCIEVKLNRGVIKSLVTNGTCVRLYQIQECEGLSQAFYPTLSYDVPTLGHSSSLYVYKISSQLSTVGSIGPCFNNEMSASYFQTNPMSSLNEFKKLFVQIDTTEHATMGVTCDIKEDDAGMKTTSYYVPDLVKRGKPDSISTVPPGSSCIRAYKTGHKGRVEYLHALIQQRHISTELIGENNPVTPPVNDDMEIRKKVVEEFYKKLDKRETDEMGHFIPVKFGGPADETYNIFPQDSIWNAGEMDKLHQEISDFLTNNKLPHETIVSIQVNVDYQNGTSSRPDGINYWLSFNGDMKNYYFTNLYSQSTSQTILYPLLNLPPEDDGDHP